MRNIFPILFGIASALLIGLISIQSHIINQLQNQPIIEKPQVAGLSIKYGDENVKKLTKQEFLKQQFKNIISEKSGTYSLAIRLLDEDFEVIVNENENFYPASLYKVPIAVSVLKNSQDGKVSLTEEIAFEEKYKTDGSGVVTNSEPGDEYTIFELLSFLIKLSDNSAQEMLVSKANYEIVYEIMPKDKFITTVQIIKIFEDLYDEKYLNQENTSILLDLLTDTGFDNRIHQGLSDNIKFAHKIGNWPESGTWHDCGIIFADKNLSVCVMSKRTTYEEFEIVTKEFGELITDYFDI